MTRRECEAKLLSLAEEMRAVFMEYNPAGDFLSVIIDADGYTSADDTYFNEDGKIILNQDNTAFRTINAKKYSDGHIRYGCPAKGGAA